VIKGGRKGRISNELVAASCAAILAVYAAGTWRTRDEAKRFGVEGEMRRPARPAQLPAPQPVATLTPPPATVAAPIPEVAAPMPAAPIETGPAVKTVVKAEPPPPKAAAPQPTEPAKPAPTKAPAVVAVAEALPAPAPDVAPAAADAGQAPATVERRWKDGYYTGWGQSRHGDIQAFVRITDGMITESGIATCETRYPCSVIDDVIMQPVEIQGPDVDKVSRATESADAYYYGLVMALENAETGTRRSVRP
jgi:uncharacterized protein with FMN-binding domain